MKVTMTAEEAQRLFDSDLYELHYRLNLGDEPIPVMQPNYTYCRKDAPIYEWNGWMWAKVGGNLVEVEK